MKRSITPRLTAAALALLGVCPAFAQNIDPILPKLPPKQPEQKLPERPPEPAMPDQLLMKELKAIVFVSMPDQVQKGGLKNVKGVDVSKVPKLANTPEFVAAVKTLIGKPMRTTTLRQITDAVLDVYNKSDQPVVDALVPEQDITDGVLQVIVLEGKLGRVRVEGNHWFDSDVIADKVSLKPGDPLIARKLIGDVNWINDNPFRSSSVEFARGKEPGTTDVILQTQDRFPFRGYVGFANNGNDLTGDERWSYGFNWGNAFLADHMLSYQFSTTSDDSTYQGHSLSYIVPLPWRHKLTVFGGYVKTDAETATPGAFLGGESWQASLRYGIPLYSTENFRNELNLGYDYKASDNNLDFGGTSVFAEKTQISQFLIEYTATVRDPLGQTSLNTAFIYSPGGMSGRNDDDAFHAARAGSDAQYHYWRGNLERSTPLPYDFTWTLKAAAQLAGDNLLGSEQFGLGGEDTVRGYDERLANGDKGWLVSTELRSPAFGIGKFFSSEWSNDRFQALGFIDYGWAGNKHLLPNEDPNVYMFSVGPGFRYNIANNVSLKFDYGWQLIDPGIASRYNSRAHFSINVSY